MTSRFHSLPLPFSPTSAIAIKCPLFLRCGFILSLSLKTLFSYLEPCKWSLFDDLTPLGFQCEVCSSLRPSLASQLRLIFLELLCANQTNALRHHQTLLGALSEPQPDLGRNPGTHPTPPPFCLSFPFPHLLPSLYHFVVVWNRRMPLFLIPRLPRFIAPSGPSRPSSELRLRIPDSCSC